MFVYVSLALVAITALIVLINLFKGLIRGLKKTIGTLAAIIISAIISAIVTAILCNPGSSVMVTVMDALSGMISGGELGDLLEIPELTESISYYISMIAAPFVFWVLYMVISIIVAIIVGIVIRFIPPKKKPKAVIHRLGGLGVGIVCGLLVSALLLMPIVGVLNLALGIGNSDMLASEDGNDDLSTIIEEASSDKIFAVYAASCGWMFDSLSSVLYDGDRVYLNKEVDVILSVIDKISAISGDVSELDDSQVEALEGIVTELDRSPLLKNTLAGVLSNVASKWVADESFAGVERIDAGEMLNPIINSVLEVLATSTKDTITNDMATFVDIISKMSEYDLLENMDNIEKMLEILSEKSEGKESAVEALINVANENPRMTGLSDEITHLSIRVLASTLGIPTDNDERYNALMDGIATVINDSRFMSDKEEYVLENISKELSEYGVEVGGDAARDISNSILDDLGRFEMVDGDAVKEFFMVYAVASGSVEEAKSGNGYDTLALGTEFTRNPETGALMLGDYEFKYYSVYTYEGSAAYKAGRNNVNFGDAASLYDAASMESSIITLEDILNAKDENGNGSKKFSELSEEEAKEEARKFADMLHSTTDLFEGDFSSINYRSVIKDMGIVLDNMSDMQTIGKAATAELVKALFQSKALVDSLGLPADQLEDRAIDLIENAQSSSYSSATKAIGTTLDALDTVNNRNSTKEEKIAVTKELMKNMTPENAKMLSNMTSPEMVKEYVTNEEKAETVSNSVSSLFNNMADPELLDPKDEEEYKREAEAVNTVLNLAMDGAESENKTMFSEIDENGKITKAGKMDTDAKGFVELVTGSKVVSKTVKDTLEKDDDPYGVRPSAQDEEELSTALKEHYESNKDGLNETEKAELISTLNDIAAITNITPPEYN